MPRASSWRRLFAKADQNPLNRILPKGVKGRLREWNIALTASGYPDPAGQEGPGPGRRTLLVVDDEPFILSALAGFFHHMLPDVDVRSAKTGTEGLDQLSKGAVDLIISDYRMPDMDGIEFLRRCAAAQPAALRVLFTAHADPAIESIARERAGIAAFVPKGADPLLLLDAVRKALATSLVA